MVCLSESFIKICSLTFLDRRIAAGMPSSRGEDWQPLLMYRNSLVHGETDQPPVTSKRAYSRKKKEYAGDVIFVVSYKCCCASILAFQIFMCFSNL